MIIVPFSSDVYKNGAVQLTVICYSTHPVTVWPLPSLWHTHYPNVVGGASLQCSQDGGCTADSLHLQGPFWWGVHLPWLSGVLDSVVHSTPSKGLPSYCQSWRSVKRISLLGGSTVGTDVDKGSVDDSVEGSVGGSVNLVIIVLLLVAVEVGGAMLVTSSAQLLLVGPALERVPTKDMVSNHNSIYSLHMHGLSHKP